MDIKVERKLFGNELRLFNCCIFNAVIAAVMSTQTEIKWWVMLLGIGFVLIDAITMNIMFSMWIISRPACLDRYASCIGTDLFSYHTGLIVSYNFLCNKPSDNNLPTKLKQKYQTFNRNWPISFLQSKVHVALSIVPHAYVIISVFKTWGLGPVIHQVFKMSIWDNSFQVWCIYLFTQSKKERKAIWKYCWWK